MFLNQMMMNQKPDINTILSKIYNINNTKINIVSNKSSIRLHSLLKFMKKNKINITKDKILLICHLFDNYKNMKMIDDKYNFDTEISKIRNKELLRTFQTTLIAAGTLFINFLGKNSATSLSYIKTKKWLIITLCIIIIGCIFFYKYTYNYMKDEFVHNTSIVRYLKPLKSLDDIYIYIEDIKSVDANCVLYNEMLNKLDIETINKYENVDDYITNRFKRLEDRPEVREAVLTHFAEKIKEAIVKGEIDAEVKAEVAEVAEAQAEVEAEAEAQAEVQAEVAAEVAEVAEVAAEVAEVA